MERRAFAQAGVVFILVLLADVVAYTVFSGVDRCYGSFLSGLGPNDCPGPEQKVATMATATTPHP